MSSRKNDRYFQWPTIFPKTSYVRQLFTELLYRFVWYRRIGRVWMSGRHLLRQFFEILSIALFSKVCPKHWQSDQPRWQASPRFRQCFWRWSRCLWRCRQYLWMCSRCLATSSQYGSTYDTSFSYCRASTPQTPPMPPKVQPQSTQKPQEFLPSVSFNSYFKTLYVPAEKSDLVRVHFVISLSVHRPRHQW
jgi:hypothetical protein